MAMCGLMLAGLFVVALGIGGRAHAGDPGPTLCTAGVEMLGAVRSGDVNGSSGLDLSDGVYILNFLFSGGGPPLPLCDTPHLVERVEELEAQLAERDAEIERLEAELQVAGVALADTEAVLNDCSEALATTLEDLAACTADLTDTGQDLETTRAALAAAETARDACQAELAKTDPQLAECVDTLAATQTSLDTCEGELATTSTSLVTCETTLGEFETAVVNAEARIVELEVPGCTDPEAGNFDCAANVDDGSCEIAGCTDPESANYDPDANVDDGSCREVLEIEGFTYLLENPQGYSEYVHDNTEIALVLVPGGTFLMGSPDDECQRGSNEGPAHEVELSPFLIAKHETTNEVFAAVMGGSPSPFTDPELPVQNVRWNDTTEFSRRTGLMLPTEAQWEYACRAGKSAPFGVGDGECLDAADANYRAVYPYCLPSCSSGVVRGGPVPADPEAAGDSFPPNEFGLYHMHGNVAEHCADVFDAEFYSSEEAVATDPIALGAGGNHTVRGGCWNSTAAACRSGARALNNPTYRCWSTCGCQGFRVAYKLPRN